MRTIELRKCLLENPCGYQYESQPPTIEPNLLKKMMELRLFTIIFIRGIKTFF